MNKKGISLIILIITIIVIIILAGSVILSLIDNNPINEANKAKRNMSISVIKEQILLINMKDLAENGTTTYAPKYIFDLLVSSNAIDKETERIGNIIIVHNEKISLNGKELIEETADKWKYEIKSDGKTASIIGYNFEPTGIIVIPDIIDGYVVTRLNATFYNNKNITGVKFPESLERISSVDMEIERSY